MMHTAQSARDFPPEVGVERTRLLDLSGDGFRLTVTKEIRTLRTEVETVRQTVYLVERARLVGPSPTECDPPIWDRKEWPAVVSPASAASLIGIELRDLAHEAVRGRFERPLVSEAESFDAIR